MILGILSDTHDQWRRTANAIRLLQQVGAESFVHCGDVGGPEVLEQLAGLPVCIVRGNTDSPDAQLEAYAATLGLVVGLPTPQRLEIGGRSIVVIHGHEPRFSGLISRWPEGECLRAELGTCDYILHGHTHVPRDVRIGLVRVINPGGLFRASTYTVATLDVASDTVRFWQVLGDPVEPTPHHPFHSEDR